MLCCFVVCGLWLLVFVCVYVFVCFVCGLLCDVVWCLLGVFCCDRVRLCVCFCQVVVCSVRI